MVSRMKGDEVDARTSIKFGVLSSLGHVSRSGAGCSDKGRIAGERGNNGDIQICGRIVKVEDKTHTRMLTLTVHNASESRHLLFNENTLVPLL